MKGFEFFMPVGESDNGIFNENAPSLIRVYERALNLVKKNRVGKLIQVFI